MRKEPLRGRCSGVWAGSSWPREGPSSSMKSVRFRRKRKPLFCGFFRSANSSASVESNDPRRRSGDCSHESRPACCHDRQDVSERSLLSASGVSDRDPAIARAQRRYSPAGRVLHRSLCQQDGQKNPGHQARVVGLASVLLRGRVISVNYRTSSNGRSLFLKATFSGSTRVGCPQSPARLNRQRERLSKVPPDQEKKIIEVSSLKHEGEYRVLPARQGNSASRQPLWNQGSDR